jgi:hypothetical protein
MQRLHWILSSFVALDPGAGVSVARWNIFKPKNPNLGKFWYFLQWKMLAFL